MANAHSHVTITDDDGATIVRFSDRKILDELSIAEIRDELIRLVHTKEKICLLLSFEGVEHLSSAALGVLITLNKEVADRKGQLRLSDICPRIYEVFKITRLFKLFEIHDTRVQALDSFK